MIQSESSGSDFSEKGIPTNCADLQLLGHKINGLHLIKTTEPGRGTKIETVYCDFMASMDVKGIHNLFFSIHPCYADYMNAFPLKIG